MKTLLILRHAKSSWKDSARGDHERPLNQRGERDAPRTGELVREHGLIPDLIISSDAVRARLTAEAVATSARYGGDILLDPRLYLASPADILAVLRTVRAHAETVMICVPSDRPVRSGAARSPRRRSGADMRADPSSHVQWSRASSALPRLRSRRRR
jgi:bisphosphoglycerate-dependent phosphoglycerate mutase